MWGFDGLVGGLDLRLWEDSWYHGPFWADPVFCSIDFSFSADGVVCASIIRILLKQVRLFLALSSVFFVIGGLLCVF